MVISPFFPPSALAWRRVARIATALVGGYALAGSGSALIARLAPLPPEQATAWALSLSFAFYVAALLWALADRHLGRVVGLTWGATVVILAVLVLLGLHR